MISNKDFAELMVGGVSINESFAQLLAEIDSKGVDVEKLQLKVKTYQQWNNYMKVQVDAARVENQSKQLQMQLDAYTRKIDK